MDSKSRAEGGEEKTVVKDRPIGRSFDTNNNAREE